MRKFLLLIFSLVFVAGVSAQTYYVAGSGSGSTFCDGKNWDPAGSAMTAVGDGTWTVTYSDVIPATYEFKITAGTWAQNWGGGSYTGTVVPGIEPGPGSNNMKFTISQTSDITITFDGSNITSLTSSKGFGALVITSYTVVGSLELCGIDFSPTDPMGDMTKDGDVWKKTYTNIPVGTYGYKVVGNHSYAAYEYPGAEQEEVMDVTIENATVTITFDPAVPSLTYVESAPSSIGDVLEEALFSIENGKIISSKEFSIINYVGQDVTSQNGNLKGNYILIVDGKASKISLN